MPTLLYCPPLCTLLTVWNSQAPAYFSVWAASPEAQFLNGKYVWCNWDVNELKDMAPEIQNSPRFSHGLVGWA